MKTWQRLVVIVICVIAFGAAPPSSEGQTARDMASATEGFLASLTDDQRAKVQFRFDDPDRYDWNYTPRERKGLPLSEIPESQRRPFFGMFVTALGTKGRIKAQTVMELENAIRELHGANELRDAELYYISIFGEPSPTGTWGWRFEGHHVAVNITMADGKFISSSPTFFGAYPAEVKEGSLKGIRALAPEEELARRLLWSLNPEQRARAIIDAAPPADIVTGVLRQAQSLTPTGLPASALTARQKQMLFALIKEYAERNTRESALAALTELTRVDLNELHFAWAGSEDPGEPHYYRIQSPSFLIEYDNTENDANHIHSVWRDLKNDFGQAVLAERDKAAP